MIDHFGIIAPFYDRFIGVPSQDELKKILAYEPGLRILDACGGTGRVAKNLICPECRVIVIDESFSMLEQAVGKPGLDVVRGQVEKLPYGDETMDRIIMVDAFHHVADQAKTIDELWRVLRSGGMIVIQEPDIQTFLVKLIAVGEKLLGMRSHFRNGEFIKKRFQKYTDHVQIIRDDGTLWVKISKTKGD